jgi:hypothetical protein
MLIIGSQALHYWDKTTRQPKDWDLIGTRQELEILSVNLGTIPEKTGPNKWLLKGPPNWSGRRKELIPIEFESVEDSASAKRYHYSTTELSASLNVTHSIPGFPYTAFYARPAVLFSIKASHINYPRGWFKHIQDYHAIKAILPQKYDIWAEVTKMRRAETEMRLGKLKTPSLNKSKDDFFQDNVSNKVFIHDDIHSVMAHREKPMYEYIKADASKVACSKEKFLALEPYEQIQCVLEEAYVIALERAIIPMLYSGARLAEPKKAFDWAIMRICTTLCSGWFRTFAVENWPAIQIAYDPNYVNKFLQAVENKQVIRIQHEQSKHSGENLPLQVQADNVSS